MKIYKSILFTFALVVSINASTQVVDVDSLLEANLKEIPALTEKVSISVSNTSIQEFMRGVANNSGLNIDVDPDMNFKIINNFTNVRVKDMLVFLANQYDLNITVIGNIVAISQFEKKIAPRITVFYDSATDKITLDVVNEDMYAVAKAITSETGKNVVPHGLARGEKIHCFMKDLSFDDAIEELAASNGLEMKKDDDGIYVIKKAIEEPKQLMNNTTSTNTRPTRNATSRNTSSRADDGAYVLEVKKLRTDSIQLILEDAPIDEILLKLKSEIPFNYFVSSETEEKITGTIIGKNIDNILTYLLNGTKITHKKTGNVYVIGEKKQIDFNEHKVIALQYRSIDKILEFLPSDLKESLEIIEFPELNSLFATGPAYQVEEFEKFIKQVDKTVPVVLIEVIILYVNKSVNVSTGIQAGVGDSPVATQGTVFPGVDMTIGADKINKILNGAGWINLGNVSPNFYVDLQAMEAQGFLDVQSTPKLSTLNGHEASLAIGNTEYYLEEKTQLYGTQNPQQTTSQEYKAINAELTVKIIPFVSGDEQITLDIDVSQSDFTERISETAPPGSVNRKFTSLIRVKNQEMVLLGGLDEDRESDSGSGTPFLSRVPIIKWFFSSRKYEKGDSKLSVLIRPTVIN